MSADGIVLDDVSRFYGEVLGVNRVSVSIPAGVTGLVGPNGSGKSTLMNLITGLLRPSRGRLTVLGRSPRRPEELLGDVGYATQYDAFPQGLTGRDFVASFLRLHGMRADEAADAATAAIGRVGLTAAADRRVAAYSKGMRQRIKLAQAIAHDPRVLVLDEPLNGLDPVGRAEVIELLRDLVGRGRTILVSSHILHEVDLIADRVILLSHGYVVAEGDVRGLRTEVDQHPLQIAVRCDRPDELAAELFARRVVVEAAIHPDGGGLAARTRRPDRFHLEMNRIVTELGLEIESLGPSDADVESVYDYLIGQDLIGRDPGGRDGGEA